jgi:hypothetical protein
MFGMIIADVIQLIFIIVGLFGAYQYRANYIVAVSQSKNLKSCLFSMFLFKCMIWSLLWIGWNLFVVSNYANFGVLNRVSWI